MNHNLLFFTAATRRYKTFIAPYLFFALRSNPNACAEIVLDGVADFRRRASAVLAILGRMFPRRFLFREISPGIEPHTARFVLEPATKLEFTYMNDVDILILESDIVQTHAQIMQEHKSIFSNRMRGTSKLTGLHFVRSDPYYHLTAAARHTTKLMDESALYDIVNRSIGLPQKFTSDKRPVHGFHISFKRPPQAAVAGQAEWKLGPEPLRVLYRQVIASAEYKEIFPYFDDTFKKFTETINRIVL